jgi:formylglycine-generating enzyme required for sulfatase activity
MNTLLRTTPLLLLPLFLSAADPARYPVWDGKETVAEYARRAQLEPTLTLDLGDGVKWEGRLIPAGTFVMGSPPGEAKKEEESAIEKQHKVTISRPFYMGKYELTQAQYAHGGNTIADLNKVGWHAGNSGGKLHPPGQLMPNAWGLYDMHGNVREFVRDLWDGKPLADATDPTGPTDGDPKNHVVRGGAYTANAALVLNSRCATRKPTESLAINGFRVIVAVGK